MTPEQALALAALLAVVQGVIGWFISHWLGERLEQVRGQIQQTISEHDTRFAYLHERRGEVIDQLYKKIFKLRKALVASLGVALDDVESLKEKRKAVHDIFYALDDYYRENRLYLDEDLCQKIEELLTNSGNALEHTEISNMYPDLVRGYREKSKEIIVGNIEPLQKQIERQMRKIVGLVSNGKAKDSS